MLLPALLAVLALSAVAASAAQAATEGPFYKITGSRLLEGKSKEVKTKAREEGLQLDWAEGGLKMECEKVGFASGAKLLGSTGANFAGGEATLELSGCIVVEGNGGPNCNLPATIKSEPLKLETAYTDATRTGDIAIVFSAAVKGSSFVDLKFTGSCTIHEMSLSGSIAGDVEVANKRVEVGKEPAAAKTLQIKFPASVVKEVWFEKSGTLTDTKIALTGFGDPYSTYGSLELEAGGAEWGVFS
jgi:hypothetical protein